MKTARRKKQQKKQVPFHTVKSRTTCFLDGERHMKVRSKTAMNSSGKIVTVPDFTLVTI